MKDIVAFDTNALLNKKGRDFFTPDSKKFLEYADLVIPDMVIGELEEKYGRNLEEGRSSFLKEKLSKIANHDVTDLDIEKKISELKKRQQQETPYKEIKIKDPKILYRIKDLALKKRPPFSEKEDTDKGFKDTYIYLTLLEYIKEYKINRIFFCSKDKMIKKAASMHQEIIVVDDWEDYSKKSIASFYTEYFIGKINERFMPSGDVEKSDIKDYWFNLQDNHAILVAVDGNNYIIEVDSGEIIDDYKKDDYRGLVEELLDSDSWRKSHLLAKKLSGYIRFMSSAEAEKLLNALLSNDQIYKTFHRGVEDFYVNLFNESKHKIPKALKSEVESFFARYISGSGVEDFPF